MWFRKPTPVQANRGETAEASAERYLRARGLESVCKNYRARTGEIDLIMRQGDTLVFVEVRLRSHRGFSSAAESVNLRKQQKLINTAQLYLQQHQLLESQACRFDVIAINHLEAKDTDIDWIIGAFEA